MTFAPSRPKPRRPSIATEEERAWVGFYQRVGTDPSIAAEVMAQLEADPEMKRAHLALYLSCRESLRVHEARGQRNQRIGSFVRGTLNALFVGLPRAISRKLRRGGDVALACLPEIDSEPARHQVQRLVAEPEFNAARASFVSPAAAPADAAKPAAAPAAAATGRRASE
jgi:hypothetical protein